MITVKQRTRLLKLSFENNLGVKRKKKQLTKRKRFTKIVIVINSEKIPNESH